MRGLPFFVSLAIGVMAIALGIGGLTEGQPSQAQREDTNSYFVIPEPGMTNPRLRFHTGEVVNNSPEISTKLPAIGGSPSGWYVTQWGKHQVLRGDGMVQRDPQTWDLRLGVALYSFTTREPESHVWIYRDPYSRTLVYDLQSSGGYRSAGGSSNLFLSANAEGRDSTLDKIIEYQVSAKVSKAEISQMPAAVATHDPALAFAFSVFGLQFTNPNSGKGIFVFLQLPLTDARGEPGEYRQCTSPASDGNPTLIYGHPFRSEQFLPFQVDPGPLHPLRWTLNDYLCWMISGSFKCPDSGNASLLHFPEGARDFRNWRLTGMYIGTETSTQDTRSGHSFGKLGMAQLGIQFSDLRVVRYPTHPFDWNSCTAEVLNGP